MKKVLMIWMAGLGLLVGCQQRPERAETPRYVKAEQVQVLDTLQIKEITGRVMEAREVRLAFRVAGPLYKLPVEEGAFVRKGSLLAAIDSRDYQLNLDATQAEYEKVKAECGRVKELYKRRSIPKNDYDKAVAGEQMMEAKYHAAQNALKDTRMLAPFNGYVRQKYCENFETMDAGMPIVCLLDLSHLEVEAEIPFSLYQLKDQFRSFQCIPEGSQTAHTLKMESITPKGNHNQLYKVRFRLESQENQKVLPGLNTRIQIYYKNSEEKEFSVPAKSLVEKGNETYVFVVRDTDHLIELRKVNVGCPDRQGRVNIISGLKEKEWVVTAGTHSLKENQEVKIVEEPESTNYGGLL